MNSRGSYRRDIDGLRALAVLSVVIYHLSSKLLPGGFVGVDVFFVISGFLITGVIRGGIAAGDFGFLDFYSRRIRRIFPSLLLVFAFALIFGWFSLFSAEYQRLGNGVFYGSLFWSNIFLLRESGYFDQAGEFKAFLHLWSLGVEEQFYFIWPILMVLFRGRDRGRFWVVGGLMALSFLFCVLSSQRSPDAAFYLPMSRFWELALGCMLAFQSPERVSQRIWTRNAESVFGILLILLGAFFFSKTSLYPSWRALLPTLGAFLVIDAGATATLNRLLLSHPFAVFIGLISYPLYLWHWTLLYFVRVMESGEPSFALQAAAVALSFLLAWLSYRFVETPIRRGSWATRRDMTRLLIFANCAFVGVAYCAIKRGNHHHESDVMLMSLHTGLENAGPCGALNSSSANVRVCRSDIRERPVYAVIGDSHAGVLFPGLMRTSRAGARWMYVTQPGCPVLLNHSGDESCDKLNREMLREIASNPSIQLVLLAIASRYVVSDTAVFFDQQNAINVTHASPEEAYEGLTETIRLLEAAHKTVAILVDNPAITMHADLCFPRVLSFTHKTPSNCSISRAQYDLATEKYRLLIQRAKTAFPKLLVLDFTDTFCDSDRCDVIKNGHIYYSYTDHISDFASGVLGQRITDWLWSHKH